MSTVRTFEYELLPSDDQRTELIRNAGSYRFVFNRVLECQRSLAQAGEPLISYSRLLTALSGWKRDPETPFLKPSIAAFLSHAVREADAAVKKAASQHPEDLLGNWPKFLKKSLGDAIACEPLHAFVFDEERRQLHLPKLGWIAWRQRRPMTLEGSVGAVTSLVVRRRRDGRWFIVIRKRFD